MVPWQESIMRLHSIISGVVCFGSPFIGLTNFNILIQNGSLGYLTRKHGTVQSVIYRWGIFWRC